jgi:transcription antitermination factor NusG
MSHLVWYTRRMIIKTDMKKQTNITEAQLLLNQEVKINRGQFAGKTAFVREVMPDGRSLEVEVANTSGKIAFVDVTFVSEIRERTQFAKTEQSLGPDANSVLPHNRL